MYTDILKVHLPHKFFFCKIFFQYHSIAGWVINALMNYFKDGIGI